jgi:transcriptional regulator with XRE-family HTH domain
MSVQKLTELSFGQKLSKLRNERALTQRQVGNAINVHRSLIAHWELGISSPQMRHVERLAKYFNVSLAYWD